MESRKRVWMPAIVWMSVIFATSSTYISSRQFTKTVTTRGPIAMSPAHFSSFWDSYWWVFVKGYHVCEFALLSLLLLKPLRGNVLVVGTTALLYAASDEFHQTFVKDRGGRLTDVMIDSIGILLVCIVFSIIRAYRARQREVGKSCASPISA